MLPNVCPDGFIPEKTTCAAPNRMSPPDHRAHLTSPFPGHYEFDRILTEAGGESSVPMCALGMIGYDHVPFQSVSTVTPCLGVGQALAWSD